MRNLGRLIVLGVIVSARIWAGHIYGTLRAAGRPCAHVTMDVVDGAGKPVLRAVTEVDGSFRFFIRGNGRFGVRVYYQRDAPTALIYSYNDPAKYDFDLVNRNGHYELIRR